MASLPAPDLRSLSRSLFPLEANPDLPGRRWHRSYPEHVPPGLHYTPLRAERLLLCANRHFAQRTALRYFRTGWCYAELVARVRRAAENLRKLGVRPGDRVMLVLPNSPEFVVAWFALHWLGAEIVPVNPLLPAKELVSLAEKTRPAAAIALDVKSAPVLEMTQSHPVPLLLIASLGPHLPPHLRWMYRVKSQLQETASAGPATRVFPFEVLNASSRGPRLKEPVLSEADLPAVLQPTGGTTGTPKIAVLTHAGLHANVAQLHAWSGLEPGREVVLAVLPFCHVFGATVAMLSSIAGGATLLLQARFNPSLVWKQFRRYKPTVAPMVPFMVRALCKEMQRRGRNLDGLKQCMSGASPMPAELLEEFQRRTGAVVYAGYGLSEASPVTHCNPPDATARPETIGMPLPDTDARIVDPEDGLIELPPGEVGELAVRGPQVMQGYLDDREATAGVLCDGWLSTGDLGRMDADGFFTIVDRKKDMIITGGLNVYPTEVEQVLAEHPSVQECAVVGEPDTMFGERVVAYIVPVSGAKVDAAVLKDYCRQNMAGYKIPKTFTGCSELPKNFLGKVRRVALRAQAG